MPRYFMQELLESILMTYFLLSKEEVIVKGSMSGIAARKTLPSSMEIQFNDVESAFVVSSLSPDVKSKCSQDWAAVFN